MWEFPSNQGVLAAAVVAVYLVVVALMIGAYCWRRVRRAIRPNSTETNRAFAKYLLIGTGAGLFAVFMVWGLIFGRSELGKCQNLDLDRIESLLFRKMEDEKTFARAALVFDDGGKIRDGLIRLRRASTRGRYGQKLDKEKFTSGYRIDLMLDDGSPAPVLYYFSASDKSPRADVVIAHCGGGNEIERDDTLYISTGFGDWIREHIEPVFSRPR